MANRFNFRVWIGKNTFYPKFEKIMKYEDFIIENDGEIFLKTKECSFGKDCVLMQSTGLVDKNGTELFEGDYLGFDKENAYLEIKYKKGNFRAYFFNSSDEFDDGWDNIEFEKLEVIGNIYENSNLIKDI